MPVHRKPGAGGATLQRLQVALRELDGITGKTGWFETAKYADGTPVAYVAAIQEFGAVLRPDDGLGLASQWMGENEGPAGGFIPPRPFMRPAVAKHGQEWMDLLAKGAKAALAGKFTAVEVMESVALRAAGDIGKQISAVMTPPLAPSTIAAKGFSKPLVDTGLMLQSVTGIAEAKT